MSLAKITNNMILDTVLLFNYMKKGSYFQVLKNLSDNVYSSITTHDFRMQHANKTLRFPMLE